MAVTVPCTGRGGQGWSGRSTGQVGPAVTRPRTPVPSSGSGGGVVAAVVVVVSPGAVVAVESDTTVLAGGAVTVAALPEPALPDAEAEVDAVVDPFAAIGVDDDDPHADASTADAMIAASRPPRITPIGRIERPYGSRAPRTSSADAGETTDDGETGGRSRPVPIERFGTGGTHDAAQGDGRHDGVIGVADHGDEVGHDVDG